jgi:hypothetical protein
MRLVFLDTGTLGMVANPRGTPRAVQCQQWARDLLAAGARVFVPEICDYEERRKLIHAGSTSGLARARSTQDRIRLCPHHNGREAQGGRVMGGGPTRRAPDGPA